MSELTSLKVPRQVRDRLALAARARGLTVRGLLDELSREAVDAMLMAQVGQEMARLRDSDPAAWAGYVDDGRVWEERTSDRVDP